MSQNALGQLKHLKTARARWPFPDAVSVVAVAVTVVAVVDVDVAGVDILCAAVTPTPIMDPEVKRLGSS